MKNKVENIVNRYLYSDILTILQSGIDLSPLENKTVLITGASTAHCYYLVCALMIYNDLKNANIKILAAANDKELMQKYASLTSRSDIEFIITDDYQSFGTVKADYVIHTDYTVNNPKPMSNLLKYIKKSDAIYTVVDLPMLIYGTVYNGRDNISEKDMGYVDLADPKSCIIQNLRMAQCAAAAFAKENNIDIKFTKSSFVYGMRTNKNDPLYQLINSDGGCLALHFSTKTDTTLKEFCYVTDWVKAILLVLIKGTPLESYNISSDSSVATDYDYLELISKHCDNAPVSGSIKDYVSPMEPTQYILNTERIKALGYKSTVNLENGVQRMVALTKARKEME